MENDAQFEKLHQNLMSDMKTVHKTETLFGHACFTEDAREKIAVLDSLIALFEFNRTAEELNEELQEMMDTMVWDQALKMMGHYISRQIKQ